MTTIIRFSVITATQNETNANSPMCTDFMISGPRARQPGFSKTFIFESVQLFYNEWII
jgi:hypothetical protein